jgi:hypothetical protein
VLRFLFSVLAIVFLAGGCGGRRITAMPGLITTTKDYIILEAKPNQSVILARSRRLLERISKELGCGRSHVCTEGRMGEIWQIDRVPR